MNSVTDSVLEQDLLDSDSAWPTLPTVGDKRSIRLLKFEESPKGSLAITLVTIRLETVPVFAALSYCWGIEPRSRQISCNGFPITVSPHLYAALAKLKTLEHEHFWIDAICIKQSSIRERNHQVTMMGDIYETADEVIVWLGEGIETTDRAVALVHQLSNSFMENLETFERAGRGTLCGSQLSELGLPAWDPGDLGPQAWKAADYQDMEALWDLYAQPYFTRTWIIQEVCLAQYITVLCGTAKFSWTVMSNARQALYAIKPWDFLQTAVGKIDLYLSVDRSRRTLFDVHTGYEWRVAIPRVLNDHRAARCSDNRDKVYGLIGFLNKMTLQADDGKPVPIVVDYELSLGQVYTDLAVALLQLSPNLDSLFCLRSADLVENEPQVNLPSWVSDWRPTTILPTMWHIYQEMALIYHEPWSAAGRSLKQYALNGSSIQLRCQRISCISRISEHISRHKLPNQAKSLIDYPELALKFANILRKRDAISSQSYQLAADPPSQDAYHMALTFGTSHWLDPRSDAEISRLKASLHMAATAAVSPSTRDQTSDKSDQLSLEGILSPDITIGQAYASLALDSKLARTENGLYCNVQFDTAEGDEILLCAGADFPMVARRVAGTFPPRYRLLGGCYVHGIMYGEAWDPDKAEDVWFD